MYSLIPQRDSASHIYVGSMLALFFTRHRTGSHIVLCLRSKMSGNTQAVFSDYCKSMCASNSKNNENGPRIWGEEQKRKSERRQFSIGIFPTWSPARVAYNMTTFSSLFHNGKESTKYIHILSHIGKYYHWGTCWKQAFSSTRWEDLYAPWQSYCSPCELKHIIHLSLFYSGKILVSLYTCPWKNQIFLFRFTQHILSVLLATVEMRWLVTEMK